MSWKGQVVTVAGATVLTIFCASTGSAAELSTCGQVLPDGGFLTADLDCSGQIVDAPTVVLGKNATLDLRGFTLTGYTTTSDNVATVACEVSCRVTGPGTVVGSPNGVYTPTLGFLNDSPRTPRRITVRGATVVGGGMGVLAPIVKLDDTTVTGSRGTGVWSGVAKIRNSSITGNGTDPAGIVPVGVWGMGRARVRGSEVTGNGIAGVRGEDVQIDGSDVTGNDAHPDCGAVLCADVAASSRLTVRDTSCDTSLHEDPMPGPEIAVGNPPPLGETPTWGVCALD